MSPDSGDWDGQHWGEATRRAEREAVLMESGKTIGALKAENERLTAALEAAAVLAETYWREVEACKAAHYRYTSAPFSMADFSYDPDRAIRSMQLGQSIRALNQQIGEKK